MKKKKKKLGLLKTLGAALPSTQFPLRAGGLWEQGPCLGWNPKPDPKGFSWFKKAVFFNKKFKKKEIKKRKTHKFYQKV